MVASFSGKLISAVLILAGALAIYVWVSHAAPAVAVTERSPGADVPALTPGGPAPGKITGHLTKGDGVPANETAVWPHFRGPNGDGISPEDAPLARNWGENGPKVLWTIEAGEGYASPAVLAGRVYLLDYDATQRADIVRCLSLADGRDIWRFTYPVVVKRNHGMSRTVPAVTDKYVVSIGPKCHVTCLDTQTGELRWLLDLVKDFKAIVPMWYAGQCPLIENDKVILAPGGDALMMAVDCQTGQVLWKTPNPRHWKMTHSSIVPMQFHGRRMYVYCGSGGVAGVSAEDGALLWDTDAWKISSATVPTPVVVGEGRMFLSGGYNAGSMLLELKEENGKLTAQSAFRLPPQVFGSTQQTPIYYQDHIYGVRPDEQLVCLDTSGKVLWSSGNGHRFGLGPYLIARGLLFVLNDEGWLTLTEATPDSFKQLARARVLNGHDAWGPMVLVGGRLIVRDLTSVKCLDVRE